jgi:hypothetical protein
MVPTIDGNQAAGAVTDVHIFAYEHSQYHDNIIVLLDHCLLELSSLSCVGSRGRTQQRRSSRNLLT